MSDGQTARRHVPLELEVLTHRATAAMRRGAFPGVADRPGRGNGAEPRWVPVPAAVACGTTLAARTEAAALAARLGCGEPRADERLDPAAAGAWAGARLDEVDPVAAAAWLADPAFTVPGGESDAAMHARAADWLDALFDAAGPMLAVVHPAVARSLAAHAIGADAAAARRLEIGPGASVLLVRRGRWCLRAMEPAGRVGTAGKRLSPGRVPASPAPERPAPSPGRDRP
ncbi:MAG: histidine phosphatase family protein [Gluconacetobacter diazotrophicus]|nr:histidine phosphatase family protein [Gluconacetobacter diazotrophicus]